MLEKRNNQVFKYIIIANVDIGLKVSFQGKRKQKLKNGHITSNEVGLGFVHP